MEKFEVNKAYEMRSICDRDCKWKYTVKKRTAKTVTFTDGTRCRVKEYEGEEICFPLGKYSMAPVLRATKVA